MRIRQRVKREEPLCRMCAAEGRTTATEEIDHIVALSAGGSNARSNLQGLCAACHEAKTRSERSASA
jgi:5-methylcytosine-specific restriction enzyme A